jgi:hypothetical protein
MDKAGEAANQAAEEAQGATLGATRCRLGTWKVTEGSTYRTPPSPPEKRFEVEVNILAFLASWQFNMNNSDPTRKSR